MHSLSRQTSPQNPSNCSDEATGCFPAAGAEAIIRKGWLHPHCLVGSAKFAFHSLWPNIRQTDVGPGGPPTPSGPTLAKQIGARLASHPFWPNICQTEGGGTPPTLSGPTSCPTQGGPPTLSGSIHTALWGAQHSPSTPSGPIFAKQMLGQGGPPTLSGPTLAKQTGARLASHPLWPNICQTEGGTPPTLSGPTFYQTQGGLPPSLAQQNSNEGNLMGDFQRALPKGQIVSKGTS